MDKTRQYDAIIIGAGPAGSAAGALLARAGRSVLLIDQKNFPRDKVCGGCLSGRATSRLRELCGGQELPGIPGSQVVFIVGRRRIACEPRGATRLVLRSELDLWMAKLAESAGVQLRFGEPASLVKGATGWDVLVGGERLRARFVLVACGAGRIPAVLGIAGRAAGPRMIGRQWIQPRGPDFPPPGAAELHWLDGGYVGLATLDAKRTIVALAAKADIAARCPFDGLRTLNPRAAIWDSLPADAPSRFAAKGAAGFPRWPRVLGKDNVVLIGDAAGFAEPFTGEGIGQALFSAECAANAILEGGGVLRRYTEFMRPHRHVLWRTSMLGRLLSTVPVRYLGEHLPPRRDDSGQDGVVGRWLSRIVQRIHVGATA